MTVKAHAKIGNLTDATIFTDGDVKIVRSYMDTGRNSKETQPMHLTERAMEKLVFFWLQHLPEEKKQEIIHELVGDYGTSKD